MGKQEGMTGHWHCIVDSFQFGHEWDRKQWCFTLHLNNFVVHLDSRRGDVEGIWMLSLILALYIKCLSKCVSFSFFSFCYLSFPRGLWCVEELGIFDKFP